MEIKLIPETNFDEESTNTIKKIVYIAEKLLVEWEISIPKKIEFYDSLKSFIERILPQVINYGLTREQSKEFIKASLNSGSYGTFDYSKKTIIEMNFNPYFKFFYPAIQFLELIIHESLHLLFYSKFGEDLYLKKFKFDKGNYIGNKKIIQLDEGFADIFTEEILKDFNYENIKKLPIYSGLNKIPSFKKKIETLNIVDFNKNFDKLYEENKEKGKRIIKDKIYNEKNKDKKELIQKILSFIGDELNKNT